MRKFIADLKKYPDSFEIGASVYNRVYIMSPSYDECALINRYRKNSESNFEDTFTTLCMSVFERDYKEFFFYFGCIFFDKKENMRFFKEKSGESLMRGIATLTKSQHGGDFSEYGIKKMCEYYYYNTIFLKNKFLKGM